MGTTKQHENPLVTNKKLKQMYAAMVEMRALDEYCARLERRSKARRLRPVRGEEACRVSTAVDLIEGDLVSDTQDGVAMDAVAGAGTAALLRRVDEVLSGAKGHAARHIPSRQLPWIEDAGERLRLALGAALSFKTLGRQNIVAVYARAREIPAHTWRQVLGIAARLELPVIFIALPDGVSSTVGRSMSVKSQAWGVPGFPVDAGDAVALYRVAQESIGRTRGNGGPVFIECIHHASGDKKTGRTDDPIAQMKSFMLGRRVASEAWLDGVGPSFLRRLESARSKAALTKERRVRAGHRSSITL